MDMKQIHKRVLPKEQQLEHKTIKEWFDFLERYYKRMTL